MQSCKVIIDRGMCHCSKSDACVTIVCADMLPTTTITFSFITTHGFKYKPYTVTFQITPKLYSVYHDMSQLLI